MARNLVIAGGRRPQLRKRCKRNWTRAREEKFLSMLAETCNVTEAARQAGVALSYAYTKRAADARFRAAWLEALQVAYSRLELVLLDRAFNGTERVSRRKDGSEERMREYSNQLGLSLLKLHRDTVSEADAFVPAESADEIRERLIQKLRRLKGRNDSENQAERR